MIEIPEHTTEFLLWVKAKTEAFWRKKPLDYSAEGEWLQDAKWVGLPEHEIDRIEQKYGISFTPDHKAFLKVLHTLDRKRVITDPEEFPEGTEVFYKEVSYFYDWLTDEQEIRKMLHWPYRTILHDITGGRRTWLTFLGAPPQSDQEREVRFAGWYEQAPKLIPLVGHRFLVSEPLQAGNPVLSVWGSDTIVYGWDLRSFLIHEFEKELDLLERVFDEEDKQWYVESKKESQDIREQGYAANKRIPYWGDLVEWAGAGWKYTPGNTT